MSTITRERPIRTDIPPGKQLFRIPANTVVVIPTYNEAENIGPMIEALLKLPEPVDVLVVDDNSPDGTAAIVQEHIKYCDGVYLLQRPRKDGLGNAYKAGFAFALQHGWQYICQMDADFSHDPKDISRLVAACRNGAEVALGSRYVGGGRIVGWPWRRWLLSRMANLYAQCLLQSRIPDLTGGFKCFTRSALERIGLGEVASQGYIFQVEMNYRAQRQGLRVRQLPICFVDRAQGVSKMGRQEALQGAMQLLRSSIRRNHHLIGSLKNA